MLTVTKDYVVHAQDAMTSGASAYYTTKTPCRNVTGLTGETMTTDWSTVFVLQLVLVLASVLNTSATHDR